MHEQLQPDHPAGHYTARKSSTRMKMLAGALGALLIAPLAAIAPVTAASAADGWGAGQHVAVGVANDNFAVPAGKTWNIVPNAKFPGTVRIESIDGKKCLATNGGKNDGKEHGVQWTGCNGDASKNWVIEPVSTSGANDPLTTVRDDTAPEANRSVSNDTPRFILRSWKYPKHCLFSKGYGFDGRDLGTKGRDRGVTPNCEGTSAKDNPMMQFGIPSDKTNLTEWEFLRSMMSAGAQAFAQRETSKVFAGDNLWVKPLDAEGNYVGKRNEASTDGYFLPHNIVIDEKFRSSVVAERTVTQDCSISNTWWAVDNTMSDTETEQTVTTTSQRTDTYTVGASADVTVTKTMGLWKVAVKLGAHFSWARMDSKTDARALSMRVAPGRYGMAVVTAPSISAAGNWKTGTALGRTWKMPGMLTVALKNELGQPTSIVSMVSSRELKSCLAQAQTVIAPGQSVRVEVPDNRLAPQVGDTVTAQATFVKPATGPALDVRYQWFADDREIAGATLDTLTVTQDLVGAKLSFSTYENGTSLRFESPTYRSTQTAPVATQALLTADPAQAPLELHEGFAGHPYSEMLADAAHIVERVTSVNTTSHESGEVPGLTYDAETGVLSGTPTAPGHYDLVLETESGELHDALLIIDAAPTVFLTEHGFSARVGDDLLIPLIDTPGTDATYTVEAFTPAGEPTVMPAGLSVDTDADGRPVLVGEAQRGTEVVLQITEVSPHADAVDAREVRGEIRLSINDDAYFAVGSGETLTFPLGVHAEVQVASMPEGIDELPITGDLPAGLTYDAATAILAGTPTVPGNWSLTVGPTSEGETIELSLLVYGAPDVTIERTSELLMQAQSASWHLTETPETWNIHAPHADDITAEIVRADGSVVDWAESHALTPGELTLDVNPEEGGSFTLLITAHNEAGETHEEVPFTVTLDADSGNTDAGNTDGGDADADGTDGNSTGNTDGTDSGSGFTPPATGGEGEARDPLAQTGSSPLLVPLGLTALALLTVGGIIMLRTLHPRKAPQE